VAVRVVEAGSKGNAPRVTLRRMLEEVVRELVGGG
jgi:hypothetical protein